MLIKVKAMQGSRVSCLKIVVYVANFIFWVTSIVVVGVALHVHQDRTLTISTYVNVHVHPSLLVIFAGCLLFFVTTVGCIATLRENIFGLKFYVYVTSSVVLLFTLVGVLSLVFFYVTKYSNVLTIRQDFKTALRVFQNDPSYRDLMDEAQQTLHCCGVGKNGFKDWNENSYFNCSDGNKSSKKCAVPASCCRISRDSPVNTMCGYGVLKYQSYEVENLIYVKGCQQVLEDILKFSSVIVGLTCLCITVPLFCSICLVILLSSNIRKEKTIFLNHRHNTSFR